MNLFDIRSRIAQACKKAGRDPKEITLVAVTKTRTPAQISALLEDKQFVFGENRVQEAAEKYPELRQIHPDLILHFIGHLQSNKVKEAVRLFDVIETIDRESLAEDFAKEMQKQNRALPCFIQVNTGQEAQKGGVAPADCEKLFRFCTEELKLRIEGLMCIPPLDEIPDLHFALLRNLAKNFELKKLSMGMSADFEIAIRYGATHIRVGSALFDIK